MLSTTTNQPSANAADKPSVGRGKIVPKFDRRSKAWRRRCELIDMFTAAMAGREIGDILALKIVTAAELAVVAELTRAAHLRGDGVPADDVVRTANQAQRAQREIAIKDAFAKPRQSVKERLMAKREAAA